MALFLRDDRSYSLELVRRGDVVVEEEQAAGRRPRHDRCADAPAALTEYRRRVLRLVADGWRVSRLDADLDHPVAGEPALEAQIIDADGDERAGLLAVYDDWLGEHGDPCGPLAALRARDPHPALALRAAHHAELGAAIQRFELTHELELFGLLRQLPDHRHAAAMMWRDGWIDGYDFVTTSGTLALFALLAPMARFVRTLVFRKEHSSGIRPALAVWPRRDRVRALAVARTVFTQELLDILPGLGELTMPVGNRAKGHPGVRRLVLEVGDDHGTLQGTWPAVQEVLIRHRGRGKRPTADELLGSASLPARPAVTISLAEA